MKPIRSNSCLDKRHGHPIHLARFWSSNSRLIVIVIVIDRSENNQMEACVECWKPPSTKEAIQSCIVTTVKQFNHHLQQQQQQRLRNNSCRQQRIQFVGKGSPPRILLSLTINMSNRTTCVSSKRSLCSSRSCRKIQVSHRSNWRTINSWELSIQTRVLTRQLQMDYQGTKQRINENGQDCQASSLRQPGLSDNTTPLFDYHCLRSTCRTWIRREP